MSKKRRPVARGPVADAGVSKPTLDAADAVQATLAEQCARLRLVSPIDRVRFLLLVQIMIGEAIDEEMGNIEHEQIVALQQRLRVP